MWPAPENGWLHISAEAADHIMTLKGSENFQGWAAQLKMFFDRVDKRLWGIFIGALERPQDPAELLMFKEQIRIEIASECHVPVSQISDQYLHGCILARMQSLAEQCFEWDQMNGFIMINIFPTLSIDIHSQFIAEILAPELCRKLVEYHGNPSNEMVAAKFNALFEIKYLPWMSATGFVQRFNTAIKELYDCVGPSQKLSDHTLFSILIRGIAARRDMQTWIRNFSPNVTLPNLIQKTSRAFENHELLRELAERMGVTADCDDDHRNSGEGREEIFEHCDYHPYLSSHKTDKCFRHPTHKRKVSMP